MITPSRKLTYMIIYPYASFVAVLFLEIFVASDFDKVAGTAIYYLQY